MALSLLGRNGAAIALAGVLGCAAPATAQVVGKAAAVNQDSTADGRTLELGASVIHKERIRTNGRGSLQLLFVDRTTMSIGPNSDLVIDEYVFDPNRNVGKMTVSLGKGVMRFVGGQITHSGAATVKTPPATIGIRGGVVDINTNGDVTKASNAFGVVTITPNAGAGAGVPVSVPQGQTGATGGGGPPTVSVTTPQQITSNTQQLHSQGGQTGGASGGTSSTAASFSNRSSGITATITSSSPPAPGSSAPGPSSAGGPTNPNAAGNNFSSGSPTSVTTSTQSVQTTSSNTASQNATVPSSGPPKGCPPVCP